MARRDEPTLAASTLDALLVELAHAPSQPLTPPKDAALPKGARVGRYEVIAELGRGGMGAVYRARDTVLAREVALKVLLVGSQTRPTVDRFRREIMALASVSHENVVAVHDAGVDAGTPFVVLELVEGQSLRDRLDAGPLDGPSALRLARELAHGLGAAHAVGVVHRDLKPENVILARSGSARIVDFGLAQLREPRDAVNLGHTEPGTFLGTVYYMAPEQVRGEVVDHRADYFALGAVLYEALTGRRAFEASSIGEILSAVLRDHPPTDARLLGDDLTRRLLGVAFRCLEKRVEQRFQSTEEILDALETDAPPSVPHVGAPAVPETRYASSGGVHIAYQVVSPPGRKTLVAGAPFVSNVEVMWESPFVRSWLEALGGFSHFIHYDRRGVGMSDPIAPENTLEESVEDLRAVLDAEGISRAFLLGVSEGGPTCAAFAARYPERARGLVLINTFARIASGDGYPHGLTRAEYEAFFPKWVKRWGTPRTLSLPLFAASMVNDPEFVKWGNRYERQCASPGTVRRLLDLQIRIDARHVFPRIRCPSLVIHRRGEPAVSIDHGRWVAGQIPGARFVELDGIDHLPWHGDAQTILDLIREHVDGIDD